MKKVRRILAIIGVAVLIGMYAMTLISALMSGPDTEYLFKASIFCTAVVPVMLYAFSLITRLFRDAFDKKDKKDNNKDKKGQ